MLRNWHLSSATPSGLSGTSAVPHNLANLAPFFVPDQSLNLAPQPCQISGTFPVPHSRTLTGELIPSGTTCQTDVFPYRISRRLTLTYPTTKATHDRVRGLEVSR